MLKHIVLSSGDAALVINDVLVMMTDPAFEDPSYLETIAENLASARELPFQRIERQVPALVGWNWDDVLEEIKSEGAHSSDTPPG